MRCFFLLAISTSLFACSSTPPKKPEPEWIHQPSRLVDNGYIVYVGTASANQPDRAQFKAEGLALEDLANECSMIPKGTRIEDRYQVKDKTDTTAYVKLALEFQECEQAKRTLEPSEIQKLASLGFTEQLKKYQDLQETGEIPAKAELAQVDGTEPLPPSPVRAPGWNDGMHFVVVRQYVAYQKEVVVLSPPALYAANSPASQVFVRQVGSASEQVHTMETTQPALRSQVWSQQPMRPVVARPAGLRPPVARALSVRPSQQRPRAAGQRRWQRPAGQAAAPARPRRKYRGQQQQPPK